MRKTICVLGGTGFLGTHLVSRLIRDGHRVRVPSRHPQRATKLAVLPSVQLLQADVHDDDDLARALARCDAVINCIGILNAAGRDSFRRVHVELPRRVAQAARGAGVTRLLHVSALGADAGAAPSQYLRSKGEGEAALRVHAADQVAFTVFQPAPMFGPGDSFANRFADLLELMPVLPLACAGSRMQPVYVGDVVEAMTLALDDRTTYGKRYPLCGPSVYTLREIVETIAQHTGRRRRVVALPDWLARVQGAVLGHLPGKLFTTDNYRSLQQPSVCNGDSRLKAFGILPTSLEAVLPRYLPRVAA